MKQANIKTSDLCETCVYSYERLCEGDKPCKSCVMYLPDGVLMDDSSKKTHCKCNTVKLFSECPYYEPYGYGKDAELLVIDEIPKEV